MPKRMKLSRGNSERMFSKHASYTHKKNVATPFNMRGGIRL